MTADEQTIESLQQQLREAQESSRHLLLRAQGAEAREEALAAHAEDLRNKADWLCYCLAHDYSRLKKPSDSAFSALQDTLAESTATSLAHLIAEKKAEAYKAGFMASAEGFNGEYPFDDNGEEVEENEAWREMRDEWLRHQAKGGKS